MRKVFSISLFLLLCLGIVMSGTGCGADGKVDWDQVKQTLFKQAIDLSLTTITMEFTDKRDERIKWVQDTLRGWDAQGYMDKYLPGWEDAVARAYDVVFAKLGEKIKELGYEGSDPPVAVIMNHDNFSEFYDEVMQPIK